MSNLETARAYIKSLESMPVGEELAGYFDPAVIAEEFPNRLNAKGVRSDLNAILESAIRGKALMAGQIYNITHELETGDTVAFEVEWSGKLAVHVGSIPAGETMFAHFAVFIQFKDGKIISQRNYDCFDPW